MDETKFINVLLLGSVLLRRIIWIAVTLFLVEILTKTFRHQETDADLIPLLMFMCGWEWFWREVIYHLGFTMNNPFAYWWERRLIPGLLLLVLFLARVTIKLLLDGKLPYKKKGE